MEDEQECKPEEPSRGSIALHVKFPPYKYVMSALTTLCALILLATFARHYVDGNKFSDSDQRIAWGSLGIMAWAANAVRAEVRSEKNVKTIVGQVPQKSADATVTTLNGGLKRAVREEVKQMLPEILPQVMLATLDAARLQGWKPPEVPPAAWSPSSP